MTACQNNAKKLQNLLCLHMFGYVSNVLQLCTSDWK